MSTSEQQKNRSLPIVPIVMMILLFGMISFVTNLAGQMGKVLEHQFSIDLGLLGNFANFLAYACMGIPAGKLLEKIGYKQTALLAIVVGVVGVAIQFLSGGMENFYVYLLGAFVAGFSMCMLNAVVNPMLFRLGRSDNESNMLIQLGGSFNSLMGTSVPILVGVLVGEIASAQISDVNPVLFIAMGVFALAGIVLYFVNIPEPTIEKTAATKEKDKYSAWNFRHFVLGAVGIFVYVGVEVGIPTVMDLWLSKSGILIAEKAVETAGSVVSTYWILMLVGRLLGTSIGKVVSAKTMLTVASGLGMFFVLLGIFLSTSTEISMPVIAKDSLGKLSLAMANVPINAMFFVLCGLCTSIMWGGIFSLAVQGLGKYVKLASGIFMMLVCGGGILPLLQNYIANHVTHLASYWVPFFGLAYLLFYALVGSKNVNKDIPVD